MSTAPATIALQLTERLNRLALQDEITPFDLNRLDREAKQLRKADLGAGEMVLGMICCLRGDIAGMHRAHRNSIRIQGRTFLGLINYAESLKNAGLYGQSLAYSTEALDINCNHRDLIILTRDALLHIGMKNLAEKFQALLGKDEDAALDYIKAQNKATNTVRPAVENSITHNLDRHAELWTALANR